MQLSQKNIFSISFLTLLICLCTSTLAYAVTEKNAGFIDDPIWYRPVPTTEGEKTEIHTALWNGTDTTVAFHVEFLDRDTLLASRDVSVGAHALFDLSVPWTVTAGDHVISAKITKSSTTISGKATAVTIDSTTVTPQAISIGKKITTTKGETTPEGAINQKMQEVLPEVVATPLSNTITSLDTFRTDTLDTITTFSTNAKAHLKEIELKEVKIKEIPKATTSAKGATTTAAPKETLSATDKPITYVEIFLLSIASFIFTQKVLFYGIVLLLVFVIIRFIYRKVRK